MSRHIGMGEDERRGTPVIPNVPGTSADVMKIRHDRRCAGDVWQYIVRFPSDETILMVV